MRTVGLLLLISVLAQSAGADCVVMTAEIEQMDVRQARLLGKDGQRIDIEVRVADNGRERAAGFQHVCPQTADVVSILFLFPNPAVPRFHMNNVHMPLDIAFIDRDGVIRSVQTMQPYVIGTREKKLWGPPAPVVAALEVRAGVFGELGITENEWKLSLLP